MVARPSGVLTRHIGQRFNPYASGFKEKCFGEKWMLTNMQCSLAVLLRINELQQILSKNSSFILPESLASKSDNYLNS